MSKRNPQVLQAIQPNGKNWDNPKKGKSEKWERKKRVEKGGTKRQMGNDKKLGQKKKFFCLLVGF